MRLFEFDIHLGRWRVLVQDRDIQNGAIKSRHIADDAVTEVKIGDGEVKSRNIADDAVTNGKIGAGEVKSRNIAPGAIGSNHIQDDSIYGDHVENDAVKHGKIADDAVWTRNIKDRNVTGEKIAEKNINLGHLSPEVLITLKNDLQNQIDALDLHGVAVSNEFGDDSHIGVSQKTLTDALDKIWQKFEDMTGEILRGASMEVYPKFFVSEDGCDVHIEAHTVDTNGIFEWIEFFVDGVSIYRAENTHDVEPFIYHLDVKPEYDYIIMCKAKIMGVEYTNVQCPTLQQIVTRYNEFYIGAGTDYSVLLDPAHASDYAKKLNGTMRHNYDVTFTDGQKLIIVMGASLRDGFIRADLNGAEIELTEETVTIDGKDYVVLTSEAWSEGDYNIDING